jgi:hypothetical protein
VKKIGRDREIAAAAKKSGRDREIAVVVVYAPPSSTPP